MSLELPVAADEVVRRTVVLELRFRLALKLRDDALGEHFAQLDAPLVERIDVPDHALREDTVLVKRDEHAENFRRQPLGEDRVRRTVAFEDSVGHEPVRRALGFDLLGRLAECQCLGLGENVRQKYVMVAAERLERLGERDEVTWDKPGPLMDQLVEGVLAVGAGFAPVNRTGLALDFFPSSVTDLPLLSIVNCCK